MDSAASRPALIINNGTGYTKMGFSGNVEPCCIAPTVVAINESFLNQNRSPTNPSYPIVHDQVDNWDVMKRFWQQCIFNYLRCDQDDHYFLLTGSALTAPESREYTGEIMFETFNVPGLYIVVQPVLALVTGYTTSKCEMTEEDLGSFIAD